MSYTRLNPVYASVKTVTKNLTSNNYGNFELGIDLPNVVISVYCPNSQWNCVPFNNAGHWCAYAFKNQTGTTAPPLIGNGVTVNNCVIYYV